MKLDEGQDVKKDSIAVIVRSMFFASMFASLLYGVYTLGKVVSNAVDHQDAIVQVRAANGGVIPGKELLGTDGLRYQIVTFPDRPNIECLTTLKRMACYEVTPKTN